MRLEAIRWYMSAIPHTADAEELLPLAAARMEELGIRHLPVLRGERMVGMLSSRDVATARVLLGSAFADAPVEQVMNTPVFSCGPDARMDAVAAEMLERGISSAVVVERDEPTAVLGIFTTADALRLIAGLHEDRVVGHRTPVSSNEPAPGA